MGGSELEEIEGTIKPRLEPFLDDIRTKKACYELFQKTYGNFGPKYWKAWNIFGFISKD